MNASGLPVYERTGPHYLNEAFSIFNELLVLDHAVTVAHTPAEREYALERLLSKLALELYTSAEETGFERSLYVQASAHAPLTQTDVDAMYRASLAPLSRDTLAVPEMSKASLSRSRPCSGVPYFF